MPRLPKFSLCIAALFTVAIATAKADIVDFEAQSTGAPNTFTGVLNSPLVVGVATFTGGEILNHEVGGAVDQTAVYATTNLVAGGYADPLTISFSTPVSAFSLDVTNEFADTYTVTDNFGHSQSMAVLFNTTQFFSLAGTGITSVTISSATHSFWDFAIDNVSFTRAIAVVPEPSALFLLLPVLGTIGLVARRKHLSGRYDSGRY